LLYHSYLFALSVRLEIAIDSPQEASAVPDHAICACTTHVKNRLGGG
jgi:hypothetical protein